MKKIKLIALDLDGTLLMDDHSTVSEGNREALRKVSEAGVKIAIATGRTYRVLQDILKQVPWVTHALMANGASAMELAGEKELFYDGIPEELWGPIYDELMEENAAFETYCHGESLIEASRLEGFRNPHVSEEFNAELRRYIRPVENLRAALAGRALEKLHVFSVPDGKYDMLYKRYAQNTAFKISSSMPANFEINLAETDKGKGLKKLCAALGVECECVMAMGDADNDLEMLRWVGLPIAMGNAIDPVKEAAKYVTAANAEDGVARAIEKYVL